MSDQAPLHAKLGTRLRELRLARSLSVRTLAARSGFSPSFISNIETDTVSPSIASLEKIANELGVSLGALFSSIEVVPRTVIRQTERVVYTSNWSKSVAAVLNDPSTNRRISAVEVILESTGMSSKRPTAVYGDTFVLVLAGTLSMRTEHAEYALETGDTAYIARDELVSWHNVTEATTRILIVSIADRAPVVPEVFSGDITDDVE